MSRLVGRAGLVEAVRAHVEANRAVALHGPTGIGKSALLDELEARALEDGLRVLRAAGAHTETNMSYAALQDFVDQTPAQLIDELPEQLTSSLRRGLVGEETGDNVRAALRRAWLFLLERMASAGEVLVLIDDVQWLDEESIEVLLYAGRRLLNRVGFVVTLGPHSEQLPEVPGLVHLELPPLGPSEVIDLLARHGVAPQIAQRVAVESGGLPSLALALGGAIGELPTVLGRPTGTPPSVERMLRDRVRAQPADVRRTLEYAALLFHPTSRHLARVGRDAEADLRRAAQAGLIALRDDVVRFTPQALTCVLEDQLEAPDRSRMHTELALIATCAGERMRHEALATVRPDADLARRLAASAAETMRHGSRELAARLWFLAADRAPLELAAERVEWLATSIETGAPGNHCELAYRALDDFLAADAAPAQRVRVRLALVELAGTGPRLMDEVLTIALLDAVDDPMLLAGVLLQRARVHLMESRPVDAERSATEAVRLIRRAGDQEAEALALPILAVTRRWTGAGDHDQVLREACALPEPTAPGLLHTTPRYIAARFAFYDDRLEEAWHEQLAMLAMVDRGAGIDLVHVLRCLVETGVRLGRCRDAMAYAERATLIAGEFDLDAHTGWFISAVAELNGGHLDHARRLSEQGVAVCEEQGDNRYLQRHQLVLGQALLRLGDAKQASKVLARVRDFEHQHGISDPTVNRWQAELVSALVALGDLDQAAEVLAEGRLATVGRAGTEGVVAQLDRAHAELLVAGGEPEGAVELLERSEKACDRLGMRVDFGRALLARAHLERRRRRVAAARAALEAAYAVFTEVHARPWAQQVRDEIEPATGPGGAAPVHPLIGRLTETEARIAREVADGASNREIAERMYLSVKTVEATLTRIYRKLDIRSRTQLATLMLPGEAPTRR